MLSSCPGSHRMPMGCVVATRLVWAGDRRGQRNHTSRVWMNAKYKVAAFFAATVFVHAVDLQFHRPQINLRMTNATVHSQAISNMRLTSRATLSQDHQSIRLSQVFRALGSARITLARVAYLKGQIPSGGHYKQRLWSIFRKISLCVCGD